MMLRHLIALLVITAAVISPKKAAAQTGSIMLTDEQSAYGASFLQQPAGQAGVILSNGCGSTSLTGRRAYLVRESVVYWGVRSDCIRVIVNHRSTVADEQIVPTYLGVQVVGFYVDPPRTSIVLRRAGAFVRNGKTLPPWDDQQFSPAELDGETWDNLSGGTSVEALDAKVGLWHGTPAGGRHDSWDDRYKFQTSHNYDARLNVKYKSLDNRLIRFTPYSSNGSPNDGPVGFDVHQRGARAVAIRVFSPVNADYDRSFVIVYETDPKAVAQLVNAQVVQAGFLFDLLNWPSRW